MAKRLTTERLRSTVTSNDRMSLTIFIAFAFHALLILGVSFSLPENFQAPMNTLDVTIVHTQTDKKNEDADYLANATQLGGGNTNEKTEAKEKLTTQSQHSNLGTSSREVFESSTKKQKQGEDNILTQKDSAFKLASQIEQNKIQSKENVDSTELIRRAQEITQLTQELEKITATPTRKKPNIKYISISSKKGADAAYLNQWKKKVEIIGKQHYPKEAVIKNLQGQVLMGVALNKRGVVLRITITTPSGHPILDEAAKRFVRLASPFPKVPKNILGNKDELHIVWRYNFKNR